MKRHSQYETARTPRAKQEMKWQQVGYLVAHQLGRRNRPRRSNVFTFAGGAKNRWPKMTDYVGKLPVKVIIRGGGWPEHLGQMEHVTLEGFQPYWNSARLMLSSRYSVCLHEPIGEEAGCVTAWWFENLGCGLVNFTDSDYSEEVMPKDHPLREGSREELREKILERDYKSWIELQSVLIDSAWLDWRSWYCLPFRERLLRSIHEQDNR